MHVQHRCQGEFRVAESENADYSQQVGRAYMFPLAPPPPAAQQQHVQPLPAAPVAAVLLPPEQPLRSQLLVDLPAIGGVQPLLLQRAALATQMDGAGGGG